MISFNDFIGWQLALLRNIEYGVVGGLLFIAAFVLLFRYMNWSLGLTFKEHAWDVIKSDPNALALYFGLRILGVLIAGGLFLASFVK